MRQPLFAFLGIRCGVPPRQTHEINAVRWPQVADRKNSPNRGIRRGQLLTSQTAFGVQLPYKGSLVRSVARFHHIPLSIMAGFYEPRASVMASAIHTSRGGTPFGRPLQMRPAGPSGPYSIFSFQQRKISTARAANQMLRARTLMMQYQPDFPRSW